MSIALIKSGTATFTNGSAAVTGIGTTWAATLRAGHLIRSKHNNVFYEIATVGSNTSVTLAENWSGTTGTYGYEALPWFSSDAQAATYLAALGATLIDRFGNKFLYSGGNDTLNLDKTASGNDVGMVLRQGGTGLFRLGMFANNTCRLQRSTDGISWFDVWSVNNTTGVVTQTGDHVYPVTSQDDANLTIAASVRDIVTTAAFTAGRTWTLPAANSRPAGARLRIIDAVGAFSAAFPLTIARAGSDTINGGTSFVVSAARAVVDLITNGTNAWTVDMRAAVPIAQNAARISSLQSLVSAIAPSGAGAAAAGAASLMDKIAALGIGTPPSLILDFLTDTFLVRERALSGSIAGLLTALGGGSATRGSSAWFFNSSGVLTEATSNNLRLDHDPVTLARRGLLIEGARTNSFTNNTMAGASAGTPGTAPTNWLLSTAPTGMTREIVGTGTEDGINYIDVAFTGTNTSGAEQTLQFLAADVTAITAAAEDTWTLSFFARRVAGSWPAGNVWVRLRYGDAGGSALAFVTVDIKSMGTGALRTQRWTATGTAPASTTRVTGGLYITVADGETVNFTVRIGLPQLEIGIFPSSPIKTSSGAVTRSADALIIPGAAWLNPLEGSIYSETLVPHGITSSGSPSYGGPRIRSSGSNNESLLFRNFDESGARRADMAVISGGSAILDGADTTIGTAVSRGAGRYKATDFANSVNGGSVQATATALPANLAELQYSSQGQLCRRFIVFPVGLANAQLQALSGATL